MELTIKVAIQKEMMTRQAADIALMGVLSADLRDGQAVTILAEGPDEAQAVCTLSKLLGA